MYDITLTRYIHVLVAMQLRDVDVLNTDLVDQFLAVLITFMVLVCCLFVCLSKSEISVTTHTGPS